MNRRQFLLASAAAIAAPALATPALAAMNGKDNGKDNAKPRGPGADYGIIGRPCSHHHSNYQLDILDHDNGTWGVRCTLCDKTSRYYRGPCLATEDAVARWKAQDANHNVLIWAKELA